MGKPNNLKTFIWYTSCLKIGKPNNLKIFIWYTPCQKMGKPNNIKVFGRLKTKGPTIG
jgi:hypothetical protein